MRGSYKRPFDLAILITAHLLLFPVWIFLWLLIPFLVWIEDRGPVFYRQKRVGKDGRIFTVMKFRTMTVGADRLGPKWNCAYTNSPYDPRVTKVGKFLRKTGLDELPQVLSVWKGDMSLVGPRACPLEEHEFIEQKIPQWSKRIQVLPGLTGLAQVKDPSGEPVTRLKYDLEYIEKMSPWLDLKILFLSVLYTFRGRWDAPPTKQGFCSWIQEDR